MSNLAIETLLKKRQQLQDERMKFLERTGTEIREIDEAIKQINGEYVFQKVGDVLYDDEHPDYIKGSQEEI